MTPSGHLGPDPSPGLLYAASLNVFEFAVVVSHPAHDELPLAIPFHCRESGCCSSHIKIVVIGNHVHVFPIVAWVLCCHPAGIWTPLAIAAAVKLPLTIQHWFEVAALEPRHQSIVGALLVPFHAGPVDLLPPALSGLPQALGCRHAGIVPLSVRAFLLAKDAPHSYHHLPVGTLVAEALAVKKNFT